MKPEIARAPAPVQPEKPTQLPVKCLRFVVPMDAYGLSVASSASDREHSKQKLSKHRIWYVPAIQHFKVEFDPGEGKPHETSLIWVGHVKSWDPA